MSDFFIHLAFYHAFLGILPRHFAVRQRLSRAHTLGYPPQEEGRVCRQLRERDFYEYSALAPVPGSGYPAGPREDFTWGRGGNQYKMLQVMCQK